MITENAFFAAILLMLSTCMLVFSLVVYRAEKRAVSEKKEKPVAMRAVLVMKDEAHGILRFRLENGEYCDMRVWSMKQYESLSLGDDGWLIRDDRGFLHFERL